MDLIERPKLAAQLADTQDHRNTLNSDQQAFREDVVRLMLEMIGENPKREGLLDTPKRVVKSWLELYAGYKMDPKQILSTVFEDGSCDEMVVLRDIEFVSQCEHHMQPILGKAHIGYLPSGKVVGLSKLARLVECYGRRLQIQEKMTQQIAHAIQEHLNPKGVAVIIEAKHFCMIARGIKKQNSVMTTSCMLGAFRGEHETRSEFLKLIKGGA